MNEFKCIYNIDENPWNKWEPCNDKADYIYDGNTLCESHLATWISRE